MKVGDYVRTKDDGYINKIKKVNQYNVLVNGRNLFGEELAIPNNEIIKSSPNIIDLIEVGDIVKIEYQGWHQVSTKFETLKFFDDYDEIRAIITKEQLESMEYKVGD